MGQKAKETIMIASMHEPEPDRQQTLRRQTNRNGCTVREAKPRSRLECMAERMAQVQDRSHARFPLVAFHNSCLQLDSPCDQRNKHLRRTSTNYRCVSLKHSEISRVESHGYFHHLRKTIPKLCPGECAQHSRIDENRRRLVECSDQVLPRGMIDPDFASHAAIHLRKQCCGNLHEPDASQHGRRYKAGKVTHDPTAECDNQTVPPDSLTQQYPPQRRSDSNPFGRFTRRNVEDHHPWNGSLQRRGEPAPIESQHRGIGDQKQWTAGGKSTEAC
jgi:hypothetical protein